MNGEPERGVFRRLPTLATIGGETLLPGLALETLRLVKALLPDVLLLDVEMPVLDGIQVTRQLKKRALNTPILILSAYTNREYIREVLANGVSGYLIKDEAPELIVAAVRGIARGERGWVSPQVKAKLGR